MCLYLQIRTDGICIFPAFLKLLQEPSVASGAQCKTFAYYFIVFPHCAYYCTHYCASSLHTIVYTFACYCVSSLQFCSSSAAFAHIFQRNGLFSPSAHTLHIFFSFVHHACTHRCNLHRLQRSNLHIMLAHTVANFHCSWCAAIKASISPFAHLCIFVCNPVIQYSPLCTSIYSCLMFAAAFWAIDEFLILSCKSFVVAKLVKVGLRVRVWYISWRKAARRILLLQKFELERMWNHLFTFEHFLEHGQADKKRLFEPNCIQLKSIIILRPEIYTCALFVLLKST